MTEAADHPAPANTGRFIRASQQLLHDARPGDAVRLLVSAIRAHPDDGALRFHLATAMQAAGKLVEAASMYQHAVTLLPGRAEPLVGLGRTLERIRKPVEAVDALNQAIAINASDQRATQLLESLAARLARLEAARERLRATTGEQMPAKIRGAALLELGATLDSLGEHRDAFRAFSQGHQALALTPEAMKRQTGALPAKLRTIADTVTPDLVASFRRELTPSNRAAPTLLVRLMPMVRDRAVEALRATPGVAVNVQAPCMAQTARALEEMVPEAADTPAAIAGLSRSEIASLRARYWTVADKAMGAQRLDKEPLIDAAAMNFLHLTLFRAIFPSGRVILSIRDPRDMAINCFFHRYAFNWVSVNFLQLGSVASYMTDVTRCWEAVSSASELPVHVIRTEDIDWAPRHTLSALMGFLGQPYHAALDKQILRRTRELAPEPPRTPKDFAPLEPLPGRWTFYKPELDAHLPKITPIAERFNYAQKQHDASPPAEGA